MVEKAYRMHLRQSAEILREFGQHLFTNLINLALNGELKEFNNKIELGEHVTYYDADFRHLDDKNVKSIYKVLDAIHHACNTLVARSEILDFENDELDDDFELN